MTNYVYILYNPELENTCIIVQTDSIKNSLSEANAGGKEKWIPYARFQTYSDTVIDDVYAIIRATGKEKDKTGICPRNGFRVNVSVNFLHHFFNKIERVFKYANNFEMVDEKGEPVPSVIIT